MYTVPARSLSLSPASRTRSRVTAPSRSRSAVGCEPGPRCCAITIAASSSAGSAGRMRRSTSSPPHEVPTTTRSCVSAISSHLAIELLRRVELLVAILETGEPNRLLVAESQHTESLEAVVEQLVDARLQRPVEVDHHVAAENDVERGERAVLYEVVRRPHDVVRERAVEQSALVLREVVLGERPLPAGGDVVLGVLLHLLEREDSLARTLENGFVDVRRV